MWGHRLARSSVHRWLLAGAVLGTLGYLYSNGGRGLDDHFDSRTPPSCSAQSAASALLGGTRQPRLNREQRQQEDDNAHDDGRKGSHKRRGPCTPQDNLMFLKTHKTASSTVLNILFRLGEKRRLNFAFPNGKNDFDYPAPFSRYRVSGYSPGRCYNIICSHMRFSRTELASLLPAGTTSFTIMRDPASVFESSFHYYRAVVPSSWRLRGNDPMREFLRDPLSYYDPASVNSHYLKNLQAFDMGFDNNALLLGDGVDGGGDGDDDDGGIGDRQEEDEVARRMIREVEDTFSLVMISEYFDESLILLKEMLCLDEEDITYFRLNARSTAMGSDGGAAGGVVGDGSRGTESGARRTHWAEGISAGKGDTEGAIRDGNGSSSRGGNGGAMAGGGSQGRAGQLAGGDAGAAGVSAAAVADASRMDADTYQRARRWNRLDSLLYDHFNRSLWLEVARYGEEHMRTAVASLRRRNAELVRTCTEEGHAVDSSLVHDPDLRPWRPIGSQPIMGYNLKRGIAAGRQRRVCRRMVTPELQYMSELGANLWITKLWVRLTQLLQW